MYHSALKNHEVYTEEAVDYFKEDKVTAFVFDLESPTLHPDFMSCDFIYCEPPWREGYKVFNARAGKTTNTANTEGWQRLILNTFRLAEQFGKPFFMTGGEQFVKLAPLSCSIGDVYFSVHRIPAKLFSMNTEGLTFVISGAKTRLTTDMVQNTLFRHYDTGGDICCGYGSLGKFAAKHNKNVVLSDLNPHCIGYIKNHHKTWHENI